jgi:uncharacterized protein
MDRREENQEIGQAQSLRFLSQLISLAALPLMRALSIALPVALILAGCVGGTIFSKLDQNLAQGDCAAAITLIDKSADRYGSNAQLLYLLDAAMVTMQCGDFKAAQAYFQQADALAERLWTESVSRNALAMVTNDTVLPYAGEDFERVMIHLMSAIGYLEADEPDEALVEARRLDTLLTLFNDKYEKKNVYREDAFARYLSGILYEGDGDWDAAFIDYRRAAEVYQEDYPDYGTDLPQMVVDDLVRAAGIVDRMNDIKGLVPEGRLDGQPDGQSDQRQAAEGPDQGRVVFITFAGYAPQKVQDMLVVPTPYGPVGMAFPRMEVTPPQCSQGRLTLNGEDHFFEADLVLVEDIDRIAVKNLDDRKGRILAKMIARAAAKQVAIHSISRSTDDHDLQQVIEAILNLLNIVVVEKADTRSWQTLPGRIYMTRLHVPAGLYTADLDACGHQIDLGSVRVGAGTTRYLFRDLRYPIPRPTADSR